jgi:methionyl-tRNA formyltransferase
MKIALLCNHPLAFSSIETLLEGGHLVGLGTPQVMHETSFRVQLIAEEKRIPFVMVDPQNVANSLKGWLNKCKPDVVFVITFPYKIPEEVLRIPKYGFFNWHTGLLPNYRGADPIFWQIANQEEVGGVTVHKMDADFDTGPIAFIEKVAILPEDTYGQHIQKLALAAKKSTDFILNKLTTDPSALKLYRQDPAQGGYQKKPDFLNLLIDWNKQTAASVKALTRATNPVYGGAISFFRGVPVHLLQVSVGSVGAPPQVKPGTIISSGAKEGIVVLCSDQKLLRLDVLYTEDGFFTGGKLASIFDIKEGEEFTAPPMNDPQKEK